jgi:hypothetical protein
MDDNGAPVAMPDQAAQTTAPLEQTLDAIARASGESFDADESVTTALAHAKEEIDTLKEALRTRTMIGQATGLLMRDLGLSTQGAFAHLIELSSHTNVKIRDIAAQMVVEANSQAEDRRRKR